MERFNQMYSDYNNYVEYLLRCVYNKEDREDILLEVWLKIWQKLDTIEYGKEKPFIRKIVYNTIGNYIQVKHHKKNDAILVPIEDNETPIDNYKDLELDIYIKGALSKEEYDLLLLYRMGYTQEELALIYKCSQPMIHLRIKLLLSKLYFV